MVFELCSENGGVTMNPRISFSQDTDLIPVEVEVEGHPLRSNSSGLNLAFDFGFCVDESSELESSSADELFSDGIMLPTEIKKKKNSNNAPKKPLPHHHQHHHPLTAQPPPYAVCENASTSKISKKVSSKDLNYEVDDHDGKHSHSSNSKSFWSFKRSTSCGSGYGRTLCPLPPLLSRSSSTGSSTNVKKEGPPHVNQSSQKRPSTTTTTRSSSQTFCPNNRQKPPLKRSHTHTHGAYANISPVLNVPSANLFGLASIFSNYRDKSKKK